MNPHIEAARLYALQMHKGMRYIDSNLPFEYHLQAVVGILRSENITHITPSVALLQAGWLHDVVEDTKATLNDIHEKFGEHVAQLVDCVTDGEGNNRKERKAGMYAKLAAGSSDARRLILADRLANMRASIKNARLSSMYRNEFSTFMHHVAICNEGNDDLIMQLFWIHLDSIQLT